MLLPSVAAEASNSSVIGHEDVGQDRNVTGPISNFHDDFLGQVGISWIGDPQDTRNKGARGVVLRGSSFWAPG